MTVVNPPRLHTITAIITDQIADADAMAMAITLARAHEAHLDIVCLGLHDLGLEGFPLSPAGIATLPLVQSDASEAAQKLADGIAASADLVGLAHTFLPKSTTPAGLGQLTHDLARYSDLVVIGPPYAEGGSIVGAGLVEAILYRSTTPVLVANGEVRSGLRRIAIAWDETDGALAAIRGALPLIARADRVDVVMVDPPSHSAERSDPGGGLCVMLSRYGARPEVSVLSKSMPRVSDVIMRFANDRGADLVVMGGYGHGPLREAILGGVTRDMLEESPISMCLAR